MGRQLERSVSLQVTHDFTSFISSCFTEIRRDFLKLVLFSPVSPKGRKIEEASSPFTWSNRKGIGALIILLSCAFLVNNSFCWF